MDAIAQLLRTARERADLSQEAAADVAGLSRVVLNYYETGRRQIPLSAAVRLAGLYGTTLEALLAGSERTAAGLDVSGVLFRAAPGELSESAQAALRLFEQRVGDYVDLAGDVGVNLPGPGRSPLRTARTPAVKEAAWAARELRRQFNLGVGPLGDPFPVLGEYVLIWRLPLGTDLDTAPSGFFYNHPRAGFCIAVNCQMTLGRQVFTLVHELGHAFVHSHAANVVVSMPGRDQVRERFADNFAGEFLVPGDELRRRVAGDFNAWPTLADPVVLVHLQRYFGVSFATIRVRMLQEKLLTRAEYDMLGDASPRRLAAALGYEIHPADLGRYEPGPLEVHPARVVMLVQHALARRAITPGDAAEVLGTSTEEIRRLLARPSAGADERHALDDLEDAAFAHRDR